MSIHGTILSSLNCILHRVLKEVRDGARELQEQSFFKALALRERTAEKIKELKEKLTQSLEQFKVCSNISLIC